MPAPLSLPDGLVERPLTFSDAAAVTAVMAAEEAHDTGTISIEEADILGDWGRPSYEVSANTVGVLEGDRLVAYAEMMGGGRRWSRSATRSAPGSHPTSQPGAGDRDREDPHVRPAQKERQCSEVVAAEVGVA